MKIFKFEKEEVINHIRYELKTLEKFKNPLNFVINTLDTLKHSMTIKDLNAKIDLNKVKMKKGKNYDWSVIHYQNVTLVIRTYRSHLTIFTKVEKGVDYMDSPKIEYGAFTLETDFEKFGDKHDEMLDKYYDKPLLDLNNIFKDLIEVLQERGVHWVWNSACLKRPEHVKIKLAFDENTISSIDWFVFCIEELEHIYQTLFAETVMLRRIKDLKTGDKLNDTYTVGKISTDVRDGYYHDAGIELVKGKEKKWQDVYGLTCWYFEDVFNFNLYMYKGELYIEGKTIKLGELVAHKREDDEEDYITTFKDTMNKEKFVALRKY